MPDVFHWLGDHAHRPLGLDEQHEARRADRRRASRWSSRSPIPDELIPADARVEMDAKKAAGYFTHYTPGCRRAGGRQGPRAGRVNEITTRAAPRRDSRRPADAQSDARAGTRRCRDEHPAAPLLTAAGGALALRRGDGRVERGESSQSSPGIPSALAATADYVVDTIRQRYPELDVPYHSRWRHFEAGRRGSLGRSCARAPTSTGRPRRAGAHPHRSRDPQRAARCRRRPRLALPRRGRSGVTLARSEGLGVASFDLFASGAFSRRARRSRLRGDAERAGAGSIARRSRTAFQVGADNPLVGLEAARRCCVAWAHVAQRPRPRCSAAGAPGHLLRLPGTAAAAVDGPQIEAGFVLATLLRALGPVWPGRVRARRRVARRLLAASRHVATASCHSTSSRNGSPTRCSSRSRKRGWP